MTSKAINNAQLSQTKPQISIITYFFLKKQNSFNIL